MSRHLSITLAAALAMLWSNVLADVPATMLTAAEIKWGDGPPTFPKGAKLAVLYGDPSKAGELFIVRLKMPANYKIPAHWHPTDENITVISGTFLMGMGDKLDSAKARAYAPGGFMVTPAKTNHFAIAKGETVVEVAAIGPFAITYVNPSDDPSAALKK
jgi:quercetin dioxygenase-like cupin family protein